MSNLLTVSEAAKLLGVSAKTIRRWENEGRIKSTRTEGGHRRFLVSDLLSSRQDAGLTIAYARVSSRARKDDLDRQKLVLEAYCARQGWSFEVISDFGSGMNYRNKGLIRLIKLICAEQVERLVLTHQDRLLRFGSDLIFTLCEIFGTEVIIINRTEDATDEENLERDLLDIISVFSARLYGSRNQNNQQIIQELKQIANKIK